MLIDKLFPIKVENLHLPFYKAKGEATFINLRWVKSIINFIINLKS